VQEDWFGERVASTYDADETDMFEPAALDPAVSLLAELAAGGVALELGIGTGRVALAVQARGVTVHGIELSPAMVARLRAKPRGDEVDVTIGDFATTRLGRSFRLAYLVFNTIMNLTSQDEQVECFRNVAAHLEPGGRFVIEVLVPPWQRLLPGETLKAFTITPTHLGVDEIDVVTQTAWSHHYRTGPAGTEVFSVPSRYVWPSELDLMARMAGMTLVDRWADWTRAPFTATSPSHVSVWSTPA
jgi:SAM-dependent methyltransferase